MAKENLKHGRTCVYNVNYHIIWSVKYRCKVLVDGIDKALKVILEKVAMDKGFEIKLMEVMADHVHVYVSGHPKMSASYIVKMLKGISGRLLFMQYPELRKRLRKGHIWNGSFYVETIGKISEETIKRYIEKQRGRDDTDK